MIATIIVEGKVQGVGFRARVESLAVRMDIEGIVRNLRDGRVEIFADAPSKQALDEFLSKLGEAYAYMGSERGEPSKITVHAEGEDGFRGPWKDYDGFEIDLQPG